MKNLRQHKSDKRRSQILKAALTCFIEQGYSATSMADIRRRSKASTGSIYHHFKSKEQLAAAVYLEGINNYQSVLLQVIDRNPDAEKGIQALVRSHIQWVDENDSWAKFLFQMRYADFMSAAEEEFAKLNINFAKRMRHWIAMQEEKGEIRSLPRDLFFSIVFGPCQEYVRQWLSGVAVSTPQTIAEELALLAWQSVRVQKD